MVLATNIATNYAIAADDTNYIGDEIIIKSELMRSDVYETDEMVVDRIPAANKSTEAVSKSGFELARESGFTATSSITCNDDGWGFGHWNVYAVSESSATRMIDYIYARARSYNSNGVLMDSATQSERDSSYVSATADYVINSNVFEYGCWAIGNHTYRDAGYKDIVHETRDEWR